MDEALARPENNELIDPYTAIIQDMDVNQDDAAYLASFVDTSIIVKALKSIKYDVKKKIKMLGDVFSDEKSTAGEKMRASKILDDIMDGALASQGIFMRPSSGPAGSAVPLGLPIASVTMTEKSVTMTREATSGLEAATTEIQPLKEPTDEKEKDDNPEQDAFFEDHRGTGSDVFRPATGELNNVGA